MTEMAALPSEDREVLKHTLPDPADTGGTPPVRMDGSPDPKEFGALHWIRGGIRRRIGLAWTRLRFRRVRFGALCDVRPRSRFLVSRNGQVTFGSRCIVDQGMRLESRGTIRVGARSIFGHSCTLGALESIEIGDDCLIGEMTSIRDHDHDFSSVDVPINRQGGKCQPIHIGRNVWIGGKSTITSGVSIGDNTVVGANSVVTRDLPPNVIAFGIPARVWRER